MWIYYTLERDGKPDFFVGPFNSEPEALAWAKDHSNEPKLWDVKELREPWG